MRTLITAAAICMGLVSIAAPVLAGAPEMPLRAVRYADLDLTRAADVVRLQRRVALALETVCGSYIGAQDDELQAISRCRTDAAAGARTQVAMLVGDAKKVQLAQAR